MYLLDTCTLTEYFAGDAIVIDYIARTPKDQIWISVVNVAEMLQGILSELNAQKDTSRIALLYNQLKILVRELSKYQVLDFDEKAQQAFAQLPAETHKISVNDRRIASIARANNMIVVTANLRHFKDLLPEVQLSGLDSPLVTDLSCFHGLLPCPLTERPFTRYTSLYFVRILQQPSATHSRPNIG